MRRTSARGYGIKKSRAGLLRKKLNPCHQPGNNHHTPPEHERMHPKTQNETGAERVGM
jgi:hypothetical protein